MDMIATISRAMALALILALASCMQEKPEPKPEIVEIVLPPNSGHPNGLTALFDKAILRRYSQVGVYSGESPGTGVDFDIFAIPCTNGDSLYMIGYQ